MFDIFAHGIRVHRFQAGTYRPVNRIYVYDQIEMNLRKPLEGKDGLSEKVV
ncbi:hypothetical protein [Cohnella fermenti]|uniref:hypothetical protein n=1 Tax=Cohnella fermenti TaxID=2565925 RepID=UPI001454D1C5|nr:hypothetical protein [Cohnella fermenti]